MSESFEEFERDFDSIFKKIDKRIKNLKGSFPFMSAIKDAIGLFSIKRQNLEATLLFSPTYITKESSLGKKIHVELLISVLASGKISSLDGVIFDDPTELRRMTDQMSSAIQRLRQVASELEDKQNASSADKFKDRTM